MICCAECADAVERCNQQVCKLELEKERFHTELEEARALLEEWRGIWRCFHCGETFADEEKARMHFGDSKESDSSCLVDMKQFREMEQELARYRAEDSDTDRTVQTMRVDHATALRKAAESGYEKGLGDYTQVETRAEKAEGRLQLSEDLHLAALLVGREAIAGIVKKFEAERSETEADAIAEIERLGKECGKMFPAVERAERLKAKLVEVRRELSTTQDRANRFSRCWHISITRQRHLKRGALKTVRRLREVKVERDSALDRVQALEDAGACADEGCTALDTALAKVERLRTKLTQTREHLDSAMNQLGKDACNSAYCEGWQGEDRCTCWASQARALLEDSGDVRPTCADGNCCRCWHDGEACCRCGAAPMTTEEKVAQGMQDFAVRVGADDRTGLLTKLKATEDELKRLTKRFEELSDADHPDNDGSEP